MKISTGIKAGGFLKLTFGRGEGSVVTTASTPAPVAPKS
jgi:hypothetical protein